MKTLIRNSFLGAMMATALMMSVATMAQNKVTGGRRPAGTTTQTTNSASTVSSQAKATNSNVSTKATPSTRTTAVSSNNSQSKVANTATTTQRRNDNNTTTTTASGSGTASGRRPAGSTSAATTSGSVTRSNGATHWPSSNSVTVPSTSSSTSKTTSSSSGTRTNVGTSSSNVSTKSGSGTVSGGRRPTSESTVAGNISKDNSANKSSTRTNESVGIDSRLNNGGNNKDAANAGNISANSGIIRSGSGNTNIGGGRRPGVDNSNHNAASSHYELTNHRNYSTYNDNYRHNDWSRPLPPPARQYRPAVRIINRPVMPSGFVIYNRAPRINSILGLSFGSYYNSSLNYLFTMGYDIDGYNRDVIYLRDVPMLRFTWADVMLSYDSYGRLYNAQFAHSTSYRDRSRFNRLYHDLYATYGTPVAAHITAYEASVTWFGGSAEGYVTLEFGTDTYGRYYTMVTVGY